MQPSPAWRVDIEVEEREAVAVVARRRATGSATAMPTDVATPWPSGPEVVSTPLVHRYSGWPGHFEPSCRKRLRSSRETAGSPRISYSGSTERTPVRCRSDQSRAEAWPAESTKRSRFGQIGSDGIEAEEALPERVGDRRDADRRSRDARSSRPGWRRCRASGWWSTQRSSSSRVARQAPPRDGHRPTAAMGSSILRSRG